MAERITVTFPDGSAREYDKGVTPAEVAASIGPRLAKAALAARITADGGGPAGWIDLDQPLDHDVSLGIVTPDTAEGREVLRHSTAHVMAQAVTDLFPGAQYATGPAIGDGFCYDCERPGGPRLTHAHLQRTGPRKRESARANQ